MKRAVLFLTFFASAAMADLVPLSQTYQAVACGGIYGPCPAVVPASHNATAAELAGLTQTLAASYVDAVFGPGHTIPSSLSWLYTESNAGGTVIGDLEGVNVHRLPFVFRSGSFLPYQAPGGAGGIAPPAYLLTDINDAGYIVSNNLSIGQPAFMGFATGTAVLPVQLTIIPDARVGPDVFPSFFAIDNQNRISAGGLKASYVLEPVPEPASIILFATMVCLVAYVMRRRIRTRA